MTRVLWLTLALPLVAAAAPTWRTSDWPEYMAYLDELRTLDDSALAQRNGTPPVVYGFLLATGEVLDGIALGREAADYPLAIRRHAKRCAYRYVSDRLTWQHAGDGPADWPYGGLLYVAQTAFDQCLVVNVDNVDAAAGTRYLDYEPPATTD